MPFVHVVPIEFNHCDPFGIVFYPRYFEMTNSVVENFFLKVLDYPFARLVVAEGCGVPSVRIEANFLRPSRLGDMLSFALDLRKIGGSSANIFLTGTCGGETRLTADITIVWTGPDKRPQPWPEVLRTRMRAYMEEPVA